MLDRLIDGDGIEDTTEDMLSFDPETPTGAARELFLFRSEAEEVLVFLDVPRW
jgi:hypothetical protein